MNELYLPPRTSKRVTEIHSQRARLAREELDEAIRMYDLAPSSITLAHMLKAAHEYVDELHPTNAPLVSALRRAETYLAAVKPPVPLPQSSRASTIRGFRHRIQDLRRNVRERLGL